MTFSGWGSASGFLVVAGSAPYRHQSRGRPSHMVTRAKSIHILGPHFSNDKCNTYTYIGYMMQGSCSPLSSNGQNISKMKPFPWEKHWLQEVWLLWAGPLAILNPVGPARISLLNLIITVTSSTKLRRTSRSPQGLQRPWERKLARKISSQKRPDGKENYGSEHILKSQGTTI